VKEEESMMIRNYRPSDCGELAKLFYDTVHTVNANDYTKEQLDAWADGQIDLEQWNRSFLAHDSVVVVCGPVLAGFGDMTASGYLDRLYVHRDYQRRGVAAAICDRLERAVRGTIVTHASITARPFFEKRGYRVTEKRQVERRGVLLTNFVMEKRTENP